MHWRQQASAAPPSSVNSYLNKPAAKQFHLATQVEVNISGQTKTLQDAINAGEVLYTKNKDILCSGNNLYYYDSCNRIGNLQRDCSAGVNTIPSYTGLLCSNRPLFSPNGGAFFGGGTNSYSISKTGTQNQPTCSNNACSVTQILISTFLVDCYSGFKCTGGDTSGDCFTAPVLQSGLIQASPGGGCHTEQAPPDNCNGDNTNPSSCPASFSGSCTDIYYAGSCAREDIIHDKLYWYVVNRQCNSLN